jgi:hypothetical protein
MTLAHWRLAVPFRTISVHAFDRGTYLYTGFSRAVNEAYFLRWNDQELPNDQVRAFFAFDLGQIQLNNDERITGVALSLFLPDNGYMTPNDRERVSIHVVPTELTDYILRGGQQPQVLFATLGAGEAVSDSFVFKAQENSSVAFPLNDHGRQFIAEILASTDKRWILGARLRPWGPRSANRRLFMQTLNLPSDAARLDVEVESL